MILLKVYLDISNLDLEVCNLTLCRSGHQDQIQCGPLPRRPRLHAMEGCDEDGGKASRGSPTGVQEKGREEIQWEFTSMVVQCNQAIGSPGLC